MKELVKSRIKMLGINTDPKDEELDYLILMVEQEIKNFCNITEIPKELMFVEADMVAGEWISLKNRMGELPEFDVGLAIKSIKMGDITTQLQDGEGSDIDVLISELTTGKRSELLSYRKIKW